MNYGARMRTRAALPIHDIILFFVKIHTDDYHHTGMTYS